MTEPTINKAIETIIKNNLQQQPYPTKCKITKTYTNTDYVDITTKNGDLEYVQAIGNNIQVGNIGILVYLNGGFEECIIITK